MIEPTTEATMRCPTCRAVQPWSDSCRRCKTDLRLLRELAERFEESRRSCLAELRRNRFLAALEHARECVLLRNNADSLRLLAVCELLNQNWTSARTLASTLISHNDGS
jgi:hypothetical protein